MGQQNDLPLGAGVTFETIEDATKLCFFETTGGFRSADLRQLADQLDRENEIVEREQRAWFDGYDAGKTDTIAAYLAVQYGASPMYIINTGLEGCCICDDAISVDDDINDVEWKPVGIGAEG